MTNRIGTAIVYHLCPVCAEKDNGSIVMNTKLQNSAAKKVEEMHNQVIGYSDEPCEKCKEYMEQGIIVVGYDEEKSEGAKSSKDLYRTGNLSVVKEDWFKDKPEFDISKRAIFIPDVVGKQIGFFQDEEQE